MEKVSVFSLASFDRYDLLEKALDLESIDILVLGHKNGADLMAQEYAFAHDIPSQIFLPNYAKHGKSASYERNLEMIRNSTTILIFWDLYSKSPLTYLDYIRQQKRRFKTIRY